MATDPVQLASAVKEYQARALRIVEQETHPTALPVDDTTQSVGLVAGLIADFGLGNEPALRRRLYDRLQRLVLQHGQKVELLIAEKRTMAKHPTTRRPGNYFARAIAIALREAGLV